MKVRYFVTWEGPSNPERISFDSYEDAIKWILAEIEYEWDSMLEDDPDGLSYGTFHRMWRRIYRDVLVLTEPESETWQYDYTRQESDWGASFTIKKVVTDE